MANIAQDDDITNPFDKMLSEPDTTHVAALTAPGETSLLFSCAWQPFVRRAWSCGRMNPVFLLTLTLDESCCVKNE